ncbi:MAG: tryptophan--tRNA ligase [Proteobacteria bacterium]|nr:tryptophan--tRNA ligase [Pseudomonadota bacterium]
MRLLSGMQPSGEALHLGNYFGALRQWVALQEKYEEALWFIADYHSMTTVRDPAIRRRYTFATALDYLAAGIDPERSIVYRQSDVPEVCELAWLLGTVTPMGMLERAHAYKDKIAQGQSAEAGLFNYPLLMAADILLPRSELVPVGQDQKQHLEMTRDIAQRFNQTYGVEALTLPEAYILEDVAVVPGTDGRKMSKSYGNTIPMFESEKVIKKAVMGIVTDSTPVADPKDPQAVVFQLWSLFASEAERGEMAERAVRGGMGYGEVKKDLLARLLETFASMRERRAYYAERPDEVEEILARGAERARALAAPVLDGCRRAAGVGPPS